MNILKTSVRSFEGIGVETARAVASANAHTVITARNMNKGAQVVDDIKKTSGNNKVKVMVICK
jgi:short-subunit dehydrogenase